MNEPERQLQIVVATPTPILIRFNSDLHIVLAHGVVFVPKARKARCLLALLAMSKTGSVTRQDSAATLWSNVERANGLARLRDVLHDLRRELDTQGVDILEIQAETIVLKPGTFSVCTADLMTSEAYDWTKFLVGLEGIDPALDRWLAHIRAEGRRNHVSLGLETPSDQEFSSPNSRERRPTVVITELDISGLSGAAWQSRLLTDELVTSLVRLRWFDTVNRGILGQRVSIGIENLSVIADYALVGTLYCDQCYCRLFLNLIDLRSKGIIEWTFNYELNEPFCPEVQIVFANAVAAQLDTELLFIEVKRHQKRSLNHPENVYSLVLQAVPAIYQLERDSFVDAGHLLERAIKLDPGSAMAHSWLAYWHVFFVGQGWATNPHQSMTQAARVANRAMLLDPKDARAVTIAGHVKAFLTRQVDEAAAKHELALQINPALPLAWHFAGMTHAYAGRLNDALRCIQECRRLAPNDPQAFYSEGALGVVHLLRHDHEQAAVLGRRVTERHPNFTSPFKSYLSALGHLGRKEEAITVSERLLALEPNFSLRRFRATAPYQLKENLEHFIAGLRLAGIS